VNGVVTNRTVFVKRDNPALFLVMASGYAKFVVDFSTHRVDAGAFGGSMFVPQSARFCVVVLDRKYGTSGVPVEGGPENPKFLDNIASWY
jgi:hypothetical protein